MKNFVYHNPTKVLFGKNTLSSIGKETAFWGEKVLLVYGEGSIRKSNIYSMVMSSLSKAGLEIIEHGGVQPNPILSHVNLGIESVRKHDCQVICGVGGGSVIDEAKAIAAGAMAQHDVWKFFTGKKSMKAALPITTVVTLAASGSEMNSGMVITNDDTRQKFGYGNRHIFPRTSILDPETTYTVPPNYTAYGAVDCIAHLLEFYFSSSLSPSPIQDRLIEGLIVTTMKSCSRALHTPMDYSARSELMWTATLALNGLMTAGLGKVGFPMHLIEHSLSALYDVPHGAGLAAIIPGWMRYQAQKNPQKFAQFSRHVFGVKESEDWETATQGISLLQNWFESIKVPTSLHDLHISPNQHSMITRNCLPQAKVWRMREYDETKINHILNQCQEG